MKIHLTEAEMRNYIYNEINNIIHCMFKENDFCNRKFNLLTEGLIQTYEPNRVKRIIERKFDLNSIGAKIIIYDRTPPSHPVKQQSIVTPVITTDNHNKLVEIYLNFKSGIGLTKCNTDILNDIIHIFDVCGWMFASIINMNTLEEYKDINECDYTNKYIAYNIYFRPKFDQTVNINGVPNKCYHICPTRLVQKILSQGLKPKNFGRTSNHTERVFLYYKYPTNWKNKIANNFRESRKDEKYSLLEVDTGLWIKEQSRLNNIPKFRFDSLTMSDDYPAIYTFETIPSKYINVIENEQ